MKQYISLLAIAIFTIFVYSCNKGTVVTYPENLNQGYNDNEITYDQINGTYRMYDSIHFVGIEAYQQIDNKFKHSINHTETVKINIENGVGAFNLRGLHFVESRGVMSEYIAPNPGYDITKIWFRRDSIYVNYLMRAYKPDSVLSITLMGYKVK